ncbi:MAG: serine hydrolase domain-containing protein [Flavobacteriales bacterium]
MRKLLKRILYLIATLLALHGIIAFSGHAYLYKGVWNTYLKGRTGPDIDEHEIFANRQVKAGGHIPWPLSEHYNEHELSAEILREIEGYKTIAYLVIKDDSIRYEQYWDGYGPASATNSFSMAKTICSILTGIAIKEGKIESVEQPVGDFLPEFREGNKSKILIRHLLTMSSGISFDESYSGPFSFPAKAYYGDDLYELVMQYESGIEPGEIFDYQSGNTQLLGFVLERATGQTLSDYASEKLWKPLGAHYPALWSLDREGGHEKAFCCFNSNARDFARIGALYLHNGRWKGERIVPRRYVKASLTVAGLLEKSGAPTTRYGYSWWLYNYKGMEVFYARGILGQYVFGIPALNAVVVRLGHDRARNPFDNPPDDVFTWLNAALEIIEDK